MDIYFSIVLFKTSEKDIKSILSSIKNLKSFLKNNNSLHINLFTIIHDNYVNSNYASIFNKKINDTYYFKSELNIGYGRGHNRNFNSINKKENFLFITLNPDITFNSCEIIPLFEYALLNKNKYACLAPLIFLNDGKIQYSAKRDPTFIDLIISRFPFLFKFKVFKERYKYYINSHRNYEKEIILSSYLSGCFLLFPSEIYKKIGGFTPHYFLHLEDADITRKCSLYGKTLHIPTAKIKHKRGRGSHKSFFQQMHLVKSIFIYFKIWGVSLY